MREESKKEMLTREKIVSDVKNVYFEYVKCSIPLIFISFIFLLIVFLNIVSSGEITKDDVFRICLSISIPLPLLVSYLYNSNLLKKGNFRIEIDRVRKKGKWGKTSDSRHNYDPVFNRTYLIYFVKYGRHNLIQNKSEYYKWLNWGLRSQQLYNSTEIGDEFYLVVTKKNRILQIYNKKYFELEDNER